MWLNLFWILGAAPFLIAQSAAGRALMTDTCVKHVDHEFGHGYRRKGVLPYSTESMRDDFPTARGALDEGVAQSYDTLRVPMSKSADLEVRDLFLSKAATLRFSIKLSSSFDFGAAGLLPGMIAEPGGFSVTPSWTSDGSLSLTLRDPEKVVHHSSSHALARNVWLDITMSVDARKRRARVWVNGKVALSVAVSGVRDLSGLAFICKRVGGKAYSVASFGSVRLWSGDCADPVARGHDEL
jgi:hypothetical protein